MNMVSLVHLVVSQKNIFFYKIEYFHFFNEIGDKVLKYF